jgi:hypothetical protein
MALIEHIVSVFLFQPQIVSQGRGGRRAEYEE